MKRTAGTRLAVLALAVAAVAAACTGPDGESDLGRTPPPTPEESSTTSPPAPPAASCSNATQSYDALDPLPGPNALPAGSAMARIRDRGALIAGVSADTLLLGARNPFTGEIEGFDIDVLRDLSTAIFGSPDHVQFRVITSGQRLQVLKDGTVDVVARAFTETCARWQEIAFSTVYYQAGQKVLVPSQSSATGLDDLREQKVCAPAGTTTLTKLESYPVTPVAAATHTECLVLFQQGAVDAITGDDTILAGFAAQDPYAKVVGDAISAEPYGVGVSKDAPELAAFINAVLAQRVADGRWRASYEHWLAPALGADAVPPVPEYGRRS